MPGASFSLKIARLFAIAGAVLLIAALLTDLTFRPGVLSMLLAFAIGARSFNVLRGFSFTIWVVVCVGLALAYPQFLQNWGGLRLSLLIVPLVQIIMFGMGTTLSLRDFRGILVSPWPVFLGLLLQFCIMPVMGYFIATSFGFEGELAAGIILIGSVSGGVASNLMAYIAGANVALSVTMTVVSSTVAPVMTPFLMRVFAGRFIPINTLEMVVGVFNIIVVPVVAGLLAHAVLYSKKAWTRNPAYLAGIILVSSVFVGLTFIVSGDFLGVFAPLKGGALLGGALLLIVSLSKLIVGVWLGKPNTWIDRALPFTSMAGICIIMTVIVAQTYDVLMETGLILVFAAILHNTSGYLWGYWGAKGLGALVGRLGYVLKFRKTPATVIDEAKCRTVAFEVGMQNGGMATGLAMDVLNSHIAALPPNIFGSWMNVSGSMLANWWKRKPIRNQNAKE